MAVFYNKAPVKVIESEETLNSFNYRWGLLIPDDSSLFWVYFNPFNGDNES